MKISIKKGLGFGLTSGVITTLGLIIGLHSSTHSFKIILGGIIIIAVADALSDSLGVHISEEAESQHSTKEIWEATASTFLTKFIVALTFIIPFLFLNLDYAIIASIIYGLTLIGVFSYFIAKQEKTKPLHVVSEHIIIAILVILITHFVGVWADTFTT